MRLGLAVGLAAVSLLIAVFLIRTFLLPPDEPIPVESRIHYFRDPAVSLNNVIAEIYHARPEGKEAGSDWAAGIEDSLRKIEHFHSVQFLGKSMLEFNLASEEVIYSEPADDGGLFEERPGLIDSLRKALPEAATGTERYVLRIFVVEDAGLGAAPGIAYVPATIFRDQRYAKVKEAILYRAIARSFGLPPGQDGILGIGMWRPLEANFIETELVQQMGLLN